MRLTSQWRVVIVVSLMCGVAWEGDLVAGQCDCGDLQPHNTDPCSKQKEFGNCDREWMVAGEYCKKTCGRCGCEGDHTGEHAVLGCNQCNESPPNDDFSCSEQRAFGKCGEEWLKPYCQVTCGECSCDEANGEQLMSPLMRNKPVARGTDGDEAKTKGSEIEAKVEDKEKEEKAKRSDQPRESKQPHRNANKGVQQLNSTGSKTPDLSLTSPSLPTIPLTSFRAPLAGRAPARTAHSVLPPPAFFSGPDTGAGSASLFLQSPPMAFLPTPPEDSKRKQGGDVPAAPPGFLSPVQEKKGEPCSKSVFEVIRDGKGFGSLASALEATGMDSVLGNPNAAITFFAPDDGAFIKFFEDYNTSPDELLEQDKATTKAIIQYHIVPTALTAKGLIRSTTLDTLLESKKLFGAGKYMIESLASSAKIVGEGVKVCGSIVYIVDTILLPAPSLVGIGKRKAVRQAPVEAAPWPPPSPVELTSKECDDEKSILEILTADPNLALFVEALQAVGLDKGDIAEAGSQLTVFAPTDEGFQHSLKLMKLPKKKLFSDKKALKSLVEYHIVQQNVNGSTISQGSLETLNQKPLFVEILPTSIEIAGIGSSAQISTLDADAACSAAIHKVDRVLLPFSVTPDQAEPPPISINPSTPPVADDEPLVLPGETQPSGTPAPSKQMQERRCRSVAEFIASTPNLAILNQAINLAGLAPVLSDKGQCITLFAPMDDAFVQLSKADAAQEMPILDDPDALGSIISYHALNKPQPFSSLEPGRKHQTLVLRDGEPLDLMIVMDEASPLGIGVEGVKGKASIVKKNIVACSSVIHIIDGVLLPTKGSEVSSAKSG